MALFGSRKQKKTAAATPVLPPVTRDVSQVVLRPVVTEKAALLGDRRVYVFEVSRDADTRAVRDAVRKLWNVVPTKVNIVNRASRRFVIRAKNRTGLHAAFKKAYVYLKEGDTIEFV